MTTLAIKDLDSGDELDRGALHALRGGALDLSSFDFLVSDVTAGDLTSMIDVNATGNVLSPMVITALDIYAPVTTIVQLDLDNILALEQTIASSFAGPT